MAHSSVDRRDQAVMNISRPLIILGEEFRLMVDRLLMRMDETPFETGSVFDIYDLVDEHLDLLAQHVSAFGEEIGNGLGRLTHEPDEYFHGVASRMNMELEAILAGYDDLRGLKANDDDYEGWSLLVEIYEETLFQIHDWLEEVVEFLDDPLAGIKKRGIPADGSGAVKLHLEMRPPRQLNRLTRWLQRRGHDLKAAQEQAWAAEDRRRAQRTGLTVGPLLGLWLGKG